MNDVKKKKLIEKYLNNVLIYNSYETYNCYKNHLENIIFKVDFNENSIIEYIKNEKKRNIANSTINKRINVLKRCLKFNNIYKIEKIKTLKEKYITFDYLTIDELKKVIDYIENSKLKIENKLIFFMFLESGLRRKELLKIERKNIDFLNREIYVTFTKTNKARTVCYNDYTEKYLYLYLYQFKKDNKYLFNATTTSIHSLFVRIKKQVNIQHFSPYVLRHTYATILANNNCDINMLKETMGHERITTTQRYIHYNVDLIKDRYKQAFKI